MTKIMLVEDDKSLREIYGVRLLAEGYDIVSAGDGEEALAMAIKDRPELIVSDVMMPKISGFDMLDILRSTTETKNIKVIMMTALSSEEQRQRGEQLGADKYLVKSQVGIEDVVKAVHEVLGDKPGANSSTLNPPRQPVQAPTAPSAQGTTQTNSSIPEPTAPFTGDRPPTLGERIIQPLKDNPRVANVDVSELMDKEFASSIDKIENDPVAPTADQIVSARPSSSSSTAATVSMDPPSAPQPAPDDPTALTQSTPAPLPDAPAPMPPQAPASDQSATASSSSSDASTPAPASPSDTDDSSERLAMPIMPPERPN